MKRFLAVFLGWSPPEGQPPIEVSDDMRARGMAAWHAWMAEHADHVVDTGGPLGRTKLASNEGLADTRNAMAGYVIVQAENLDAAARLFENHPHFAIFPGRGVEIVECLPIPGT